MSAAQGVHLILDDLGPQRRDDDFLVALRMGIVSRQPVPASVAIAGLDRDQFVHLLDRYPRAAVSFVPGLSARRAPRGPATAGGIGTPRGGTRRGGLSATAGSPLATGQLFLQGRDPCGLLLHDLLKLPNPFRRTDHQHLHRRRGALPVAVGNRNLRGSFHGGRPYPEKIGNTQPIPKIPTNPKTRIGISLHAQTTAGGLNGYFSSVECLDHIHSHERGYVGALKSNRKVEFKGGLMRAAEVAAHIPAEDRKQVSIGKRKQWYFTKTLSLPKLKHRVRLVILWDRKNGKEAVKFLLTHRVHWEISRILNVYRKRWTGTETFHRDGKHHLGMGDCQLRSGEGQTRHRYLVMLTHSLLMARMRQGRARDWAHSVLTTIGEACRAVSRETLSKTITWAVEQAITVGWTQERIVTHLKLV